MLTLILQKERKGENAIFDEIIEQSPENNDRFYIEHDRQTNTFTVKEHTHTHTHTHKKK